jgi:Protease inhibitor Inh
MNNLKLLFISSTTLALITFSAAQADPAGSYKLAIGAKATCAITLAADGTATYTGACDQGAEVARWQAKASGVELKKASGETVAVLKGKDGAYTGTRFEDGRTLTLNADSAALASTH